jgi:hypothetical protein
LIFEKKGGAMISKSRWELPFGNHCDSRCDTKLEGFFILLVAGCVIATLALLGFLSKIMNYEIQKILPVSYGVCVSLSVSLLWLSFWPTWKFLRRKILSFWCRHCPGSELSKRVEEQCGFMHII